MDQAYDTILAFLRIITPYSLMVWPPRNFIGLKRSGRKCYIREHACTRQHKTQYTWGLFSTLGWGNLNQVNASTLCWHRLCWMVLWPQNRQITKHFLEDKRLEQLRWNSVLLITFAIFVSFMSGVGLVYSMLHEKWTAFWINYTSQKTGMLLRLSTNWHGSCF